MKFKDLRIGDTCRVLLEEYFGYAVKINRLTDKDNGEFVVWNAKTKDEEFYLFIPDEFEVVPAGGFV